MKFLFLLLMPLFLGQQPASLTTSTPQSSGVVKAANKVYVCDSRSSVAYHSSRSCRGLGRCTHEIIELTEKEAQENYSKRKCQICY